MKTYPKLMRKAQRFVDKLQSDITTGKRKICENYGQREIQRFITRELCSLPQGRLSYSEQCDIKEILHKVSAIH